MRDGSHVMYVVCIGVCRIERNVCSLFVIHVSRNIVIVDKKVVMFRGNVKKSRYVRCICVIGMVSHNEIKVYVERKMCMNKIIEFKLRSLVVNGFVL